VHLFRDSPIKFKIILIALAVSAVSLVLASASFVAYEFVNARQTALEHVATAALAAADERALALSSRDREAATKSLSVFEAEGQILAACLYTAAGELFASYSRPDLEPDCPIAHETRGGHEFHYDQVNYEIPIRAQGVNIGGLMIRADTLEIQSRLKSYLLILGLALIASGAVAILLASRLQRFISGPILGLVATSRRVSFEKNYTIRATRGGDDELGRLVDSYNEMLEQIQQRDKELERHREHLDDKIAARTKELEQVIEELQDEISQRERAEEQIRFLADYDVLTGLPNRRLLRERLEGAIAGGPRHEGRPLALLFLDLDRFKEINDSWGHAMGDNLLEQVAVRLVGCVRDSDHVARSDEAEPPSTVSRQGGDEFTVLLTGISSGHDASRVATRILEALQHPFTLPDRDVVIGASIGIAVFPEDGTDSETLFKHADTAMYHAKENGRNDFEYFSDYMKAAALGKLTMEGDLRTAIEEEQFFLHYQPQVDMKTGEVIEVEALIRWQHPEKGLVSPGDFIPAAEECGLITRMGDWVLKEACRQCAEWNANASRPIRVAVNVSSHQFRKRLIFDSVLEALNESGLDATLLELEVTESGMLENEETAIETLARLKDRGVRVALDDFGTGYSSLSYLQRLPLDSLKIDRSFITDLDVGEENHSIVAAIITMAHGLGLEVVAEGVETTRQRIILNAWGCDVGQGFLYSRPVTPDEIAEMLEG
jgi:diguanylate cyclase (GGDEF)-like protein